MKTTAEMIEVMQAFERGESIQVCDIYGSPWRGIGEPSWNWVSNDYRIAPREPRVIWVNEYEYKRDEVFESQDGALMCIEPNPTRTAIKYIEVIE